MIAEKRSSHLRYALVTGAGSGLGKAFCLQLARDGWNVACADIDEQAASATAQECISAGGQARVEQLDVASRDQWQSLGERLKSDWPRLDLLINNAGICGAGEVGEVSLDDSLKILKINLDGTVFGCHTMIPWMKEQGRGHIVNIASIASFISAPSMAAYGMSKAAVLSLSETLYSELRPLGVDVTVVMPTFFASQLTKRGMYHSDRHRDAAERYTQKSKISAEEVVHQTLKAVRKRKLYVVLGFRARMVWRWKRLAPTSWQKLVARVYR